MSPRPFLRSTIVELEELFAAKRTDSDTLNALKTELQFRNVPRATALLAKVKNALSGDTSLIPTAQPGLFATALQPAPQRPQPTTSGILPKPIPKPAEKPPEVPAMPLDEAYKLLRVTAGTPWDEVEQARARLVQRSHPDALEGLSGEKRAAALSEAKRANAAYAALAKERSHNL
jgi:DnaJ-domain-containing protein 1